MKCFICTDIAFIVTNLESVYFRNWHQNILYFCNVMHLWNKYLVFPLIAVLLISIQGVSFFTHHCSVSGDTSVNLYTPASCDHHSTSENDHQTCCNNHDHCYISEHLAKESDNCCTDFHVYLKLDILGLQLVSKKIDFNKVLFVQTLQSVDTQEHSFNISDLETVFEHPKPPPKTGSFIVILHQSLKIPDFLS